MRLVAINPLTPRGADSLETGEIWSFGPPTATGAFAKSRAVRAGFGQRDGGGVLIHVNSRGLLPRDRSVLDLRDQGCAVPVIRLFAGETMVDLCKQAALRAYNGLRARGKGETAAFDAAVAVYRFHLDSVDLVDGWIEESAAGDAERS